MTKRPFVTVALFSVLIMFPWAVITRESGVTEIPFRALAGGLVPMTAGWIVMLIKKNSEKRLLDGLWASGLIALVVLLGAARALQF